MNRQCVEYGKRVEDKLIKSGKFSLPGKKALSSAEVEWSVVIVDVGESPIERPKKSAPPAPRFPRRKDGASTASILQWEKEKAYLKISSSHCDYCLKVICTTHGAGKEHDASIV